MVRPRRSELVKGLGALGHRDCEIVYVQSLTDFVWGDKSRRSRRQRQRLKRAGMMSAVLKVEMVLRVRDG
jgi:hypothetical protein